MNNKKQIIILALIFIAILVIGVVWYTTTQDKEQSLNVVNAEGNTAFEKIENVLEESGFTYDYTPLVGTNYGAKIGAQYALNDGTIIQVYEYVKDSVVYKDIIKTRLMYVLDTDVKYEVAVVRELNIAIRYINKGDRISTITEMFK